MSAPALLALSSVLAAPAAGQASFLVTPASNVPASGGVPEIDDSSLALVGAGGPALAFSEGHWRAMTGVVPGDVDALGTRPGALPGHHGGYAFSFLSNEAGFLDGDVLGFAVGGGLEIVVAEEDLATGLGTPGAAIDVDAVTWDAEGRLCFSLQNDLDGTFLGPVEDGDVLRLEADGSVTRLLTELDVQDAFTQATGLTGAVGDVLGACWVEGELWVTTQGPTSHDGALLSTGLTTGVPMVQLDEDAVGLGGAELSGLALAPSSGDAGRMWMAATEVQKGDFVTATYTGGTPGGSVLVLPAGNVGYAPVPEFPGIGAWFFDLADPTLNQALSGPPSVIPLDASGSLTIQFPVPTVGSGGTGWAGEAGWTFHCVDVVSQTLAAPYRIHVTD